MRDWLLVASGDWEVVLLSPRLRSRKMIATWRGCRERSYKYTLPAPASNIHSDDATHDRYSFCDPFLIDPVKCECEIHGTGNDDDAEVVDHQVGLGGGQWTLSPSIIVMIITLTWEMDIISPYSFWR